MPNLIVFLPQAQFSARRNLEEFISINRDLITTFGADLPFDDNRWDVTAQSESRGKYSRQRISFTSWRLAHSGEASAFAEPFLSFSKAYVRYQHSLRPHKGFHGEIAALRAIEASLSEFNFGPDPTAIAIPILNRAAQIVLSRFAPGTAYAIGQRLQVIAAFVVENNLASQSSRWRNPIRRAADVGRIGPEFDKRRSSRLPSSAALAAMPKAFLLAVEPCDVLASCVLALLCSAPDRIGEVLTLREDCEVEQPRDRGQPAYGLRWWPAKGGDAMVKWVVPSMAPVVKAAIARVRSYTDQARKMAIWYEANPDSLYLSSRLEHLRKCKSLSMPEVASLLFERPDLLRRSHGSAAQWCRLKRVPLQKIGRKLTAKFSEVEKAVLELLPAGFPLVNSAPALKHCEMLFLIPRGGAAYVNSSYACAFEPYDYKSVRDSLGGRTHHGRTSMFDRLQLFEDDGSPIRITTHQLRHYLTTLALAGGMDQLDVAKWSGRPTVRQNRAYDHVSAQEMVVRIRSAVGDDTKMFGQLSKVPSRVPILREDFARLVIPTAHTTDFGFCIHDYTMSPCQKHRDCLSCGDLLCVKGDTEKEARLRARQRETRTLLVQAEAAMTGGENGATRWVTHHRASLARIDQLCGILDNPNVPVGAFVQLTDVGSQFSSVNDFLAGRKKTLGFKISKSSSSDDKTVSKLKKRGSKLE